MKQRHILVFGMLMTVLSAAFFFSCEHPVDQVQTQNKAVPPQDVTPPAPVTNLTASYSSDNQTITVIWQNPTDEDFKELQLICKKDNTVVKQETLGKDKAGFTVTGIPEDGSTYTITVKAKDNAGNESSPAEVTVTALVTPEITEVKLDRTRLDTAVADRNITVTIKGQHFRKLTKLVVRVMEGSQTQQEQEAAIDVTNNTATATLQAPIPSTPPLTKHGIYYKVNIFIDGTTLAGKWTSFTVTPPAKVDSIYVYPSSIPFNFTEPVTVTVKGSNLDLRGETEIKLFDSHGNEVPSSTVTVEANVGKNIEKFEKKITPPFASGTYTVKVFFKGIVQTKTAKLKRYEAPEITSVTIPKAGTSYSGKMLPVTVRGKNFSGLNKAFSVSGARFTDFKVWSNTEATTEIECPSVAGNTVITVHCGTASKTGMLSVIDSSAYAPGMIVLADKTLTAKEAYTAINPSNPPVGIVFDIYGVPKILALHVSGQKLTWAKNFTSGYTTLFEKIICTPDKTGEGAAGTATFRGDTDGSDNWDYVKSIDPAGTAVAANYPAFNWVNTYNTTYAAQLGSSNLMWYMPSIAELCEIYKNKEKIDASLKAIHDLPDGGTYADTSFKSESYWSSSQVQNYNSGKEAWSVFFQTGSVSKTAKFIDLLTCAIADF
ncbi:MAG: fibronectin type III domain-containing protein [Treponema lecithinolyticum]|uniref:fibronectin type III domain-containing protein n=1 Tax=Treponema lecithinolyticum TaxID=53418 RepID=UPI003FA279FC